jgi:UDP-galactopyranose mutase
MRPYNFKVWATPAELMGFDWIGERVSVVDLEAVVRHVVYDEAPAPWGPNDVFRYPLRGGTGKLCTRIAEPLLDRIEFGSVVTSVDLESRKVRTDDGRSFEYDRLLSTCPLNHLVARAESAPDAVRRAAGDLTWSGSHIVGVGLDRPAASTKNWIYFPEPDVPFYRVTYLSNYSPYMTPARDQTLFLAETSRSPYRQSDAATIVDDVIDGLVRTGLMTDDDRDLVLTGWRCSPDMSYPVPAIGRDAALDVIQPWLQTHDVWSRGRFGAWLYEIGNMDHSFMQGVEWVDHVLAGEPEITWTTRDPSGY